MELAFQGYWQLPPITRTYATACFLTSLSCQLDLVNPFHLYLNWYGIGQGQIWRLFTNFFFFGSFGIDFLFHMFFLIRYTRSLEEGSFRGRTADFFYMMFFGAFVLTASTPVTHVIFLGPSLAFMMVYLWGRRNAGVRLNFLGFEFNGPYLPWVLLGLGLLLGHSIISDLLGMFAGHCYYYLEDCYPVVTGHRILKTPAFIKWLVEGTASEPEYEGDGAVDPDRPLPGGFDWGGANNQNEDNEDENVPAE